ncbi:calmodulin-binding transcription activator 2-like isoform X2 [Rhodamnia argentea]|uniref:Calmodulin-binding transcription activator 2-like isoform X2 n=1 Tax=Rhodamnia argentea TaxID=178133 RepID=A0ABM3GWV2_9MYRT|nr:calmodulin-binding transcription activator 2-like isoform X2 [Rhodamnia argentea]
MAQRGSYGLSPQLDIEQLQVEAQNRWLRPAEICEILRNFQKFQIASEPPTRPPSGSLFLFDRKVLRYFRKDGHNWRKKRDGKTVKEAHEKLKVGSVDVLHCYYAHGEENENFQRRSYWMLEQDLMHIVFVHYLEVKGNRTNVSGVRENEEGSRSFQKDSSPSYSYSMNHGSALSGNTDSTSPTSTLTSLCEDADSEIHRNTSGLHTFPSSLQKEKGSPMNKNAMSSNTYFPSSYPENHEGWSLRPDANITSTIHVDGSTDTGSGIQSQKSLGLASWEEILKQSMSGSAMVSSHAPSSSSQAIPSGVVFEQENMVLSELLGGESVSKQQLSIPVSTQSHWQVSGEDGPWTMDQSLDLDLDLAYEPDIGLLEQNKQNSESQDASGGLTQQYEHLEVNGDRNLPEGGEVNYGFAAKRLLSDGEDGLKKVDSFSRWISRELGDVEDLQVQSTSGLPWSTVDCGNVEESSLGPSISQDQLFSILDFSPKWAYGDSGIKVLITGTFLKNRQEVAKHNWSCMFGELEVPTTVLADGILSCRTPAHVIGRVPFYVTCSNRLACSEVREFDFRAGPTKGVDISGIYDNALEEMHLHSQLERLLSSNAAGHSDDSVEGLLEKRKLIGKIIALKDEEDSYRVNLYQHEAKEELLQKLLKEKLYSWLLHKVIEDGKGPCVLDNQGQGAIHLAAALGYNWAIRPILSAGVSINFRDVNGWTALHWAAFCGREQTVAVLLSLDAAPGVLSDPTPEYPLGRTPADLASVNGHKGISGFIAECMLTSYLEPLTVNDPKEDSPLEVTEKKAVQTISERSPTPLGDGDQPDVLSLKDSLNAVCNATQAAHRIHLMFRIQSFQRKKLETGDDASEFSDERAIALAATKNRGTWLSDGLAHGAAIQIQKKFRGWKKRKEFLTIRQRIVKIQAHVRGHQVRKQYKTIIWSVGILEKIILRWRRKGSGLRGYRSDALNKHTSQQALPQKEDDYDFLKDGRKQTEERLQKALTRVKSMVQYPEARSQYRRLLNVVEGIRENKAHDMGSSNSAEVADGEEDLLDIDSLLDDDTLMSITFD